ncbi:MAG: single-stranded DNA-binding protein [Candidatus Omnitrophica bacterium]|nr:single-stranded DNA-binding protein [Candidatus Omnitrophota bacterium]MBU2043973.1 single-stranded DNA-binding protein [Candidatus Omnitrophota bacterium]MBU2250791.1 single-stranded DNA-binding protein [Candidatus Omnitrophota bacterium]MBU2266104.1 single-stranded DNA-binding protein [Candidatus Omnitrophota bacterium]MBU2473420.1 single-stranded DNA-binding protein [Candidatus Omnitrophota bacterium]
MLSFNKVFMVGNLTKDPELRYTPQGTAVTTLRIASNSSFKDKTGQQQKSTCFVNVVVWGQMAEVCNQYLQKGRQVLVEGRLQSRNWQNAEGKNRSTLEVVAARVQFMSSGQPREQQSSSEVDLGEAPEEVFNLEGDNSPNKEAI